MSVHQNNSEHCLDQSAHLHALFYSGVRRQSPYDKLHYLNILHLSVEASAIKQQVALLLSCQNRIENYDDLILFQFDALKR